MPPPSGSWVARPARRMLEETGSVRGTQSSVAQGLRPWGASAHEVHVVTRLQTCSMIPALTRRRALSLLAG